MFNKLLVTFLALAYCITETRYFGSNWTPQSPEEVIADGIALVLICIALGMKIDEKE